MKTQIRQHLNDLKIVLHLHHQWENAPPSPEQLASVQPFSVDTLSATQWLQWIFIPRMNALLDANSPLPQKIAISPYLEEALKNEPYLNALLKPIYQIEHLLQPSYK